MERFDDRHFTAYFNRLTLLTLGVLMAVSLAVVGYQVHSRSSHEDAQLVERLRTRALAIDNLIVSVTEQVQLLQVAAEDHFLDPPSARSLLFRALAASGPQRYALDHVPAPYSPALVGNLTGAGELDPLPPDLADELEMALGLNSLLHGVQRNIPDAAWVYYTSARRFINIHPWVPSSQAAFTDAFYDKPFFRLGQPQLNPERATRWTPMYVDAYGKGMMVTATRPVYRGPQFLGTVSIDITLDELTRLVREHAEPRGELMIVNEHGELIAHPTATSAGSPRVTRFADALPAPLRPRIEGLLQAGALQPQRAEGHLVLWGALQNAPWRLVFVAEQPTALAQLLEKSGWVIPVLLGALTAMLVVLRVLTFREFIQPAEGLVRHIHRESEGLPSPVGRHPRPWLPWFEAVSSAFRQNRVLLQELRQANAQLSELNLSLQRYTPRVVLVVSTEGGCGATTLAHLIADTLARKGARSDKGRAGVMLEFPQPERLAAGLGLAAGEAVHAHANGYDVWCSTQLGQVPEAGVPSLLMARLLDRYADIVIGTRLPAEPAAQEAQLAGPLEPLLRYAKAVVLLVPPAQAEAAATRQLLRLLKQGVRQDKAQVCVMARAAAPDAAPGAAIAGADFVLPWLPGFGPVGAQRFKAPAVARELLERLVDRMERVHQIAAFIPTTVGVDRPADTSATVQQTLAFFTARFGGATAARAQGAWHSASAGIVSEEVHLVTSHTTQDALGRHLDEVIEHMKRLKVELGQEAMAIEVDRRLMLL